MKFVTAIVSLLQHIESRGVELKLSLIPSVNHMQTASKHLSFQPMNDFIVKFQCCGWCIAQLVEHWIPNLEVVGLISAVFPFFFIIKSYLLITSFFSGAIPFCAPFLFSIYSTYSEMSLRKPTIAVVCS